MNEELERNKLGGVSGRDTYQEGKNSSFLRNGFEHFTFSPKTIVSWGFLCGIIGLFVASISSYKASLSEIDERISNNRQLNKTLDNHEFRIKDMEARQSINETNIRNAEAELQKRRR